MKCPVCGEGSLESKLERRPVSFNGRCETLDTFYSECDCCGSEIVTSGQARQNKRIMNAYKKRTSGLLTGVQVAAFRKSLGFSQAKAAALFGGGPVAFSKYENDEIQQSASMDRLMRVAAHVRGALEYLEANFSQDGARSAWHRDGFAVARPVLRPSRLPQVPAPTEKSSYAGWKKVG